MTTHRAIVVLESMLDSHVSELVFFRQCDPPGNAAAVRCSELEEQQYAEEANALRLGIAALIRVDGIGISEKGKRVFDDAMGDDPI